MMQIVKEVKANPMPSPGVDITLRNPQNRTYNNNTVPVVFTLTEIHYSRYHGINFVYSLDNKQIEPIVNFTATSERIPINFPVHLQTTRGEFLLFNLSEGWHKITVYCDTGYLNSYNDEDTVDFFVDTIPVITLLSFENRTFETCDVSLNLTVNQAFSKITYSLDGQDNITIRGNTTLSDLSYGEHNVTVFVTDTNGNTGNSETVFFTIAEPPVPFPTLVATASLVTITVFVVFLLMRKHNSSWKCRA